jgi:hypothetical protein
MERTNLELVTGEVIPVADLVETLKLERRKHIVQGQTIKPLSAHPKPRSLDYWLRARSRHPNTKLADNGVLEQLVATGLFELQNDIECPDSGRKCKGLTLQRPPRSPKRLKKQDGAIMVKKKAGSKKRVSPKRSVRFIDPHDPTVAVELASEMAAHLEPLKLTTGKNYNYTVGDTARNELEQILGAPIPEKNPHNLNIFLRDLLKGWLVEDDESNVEKIRTKEEIWNWIVKYWGLTDKDGGLTDDLKEILKDRVDQWQKRHSKDGAELAFKRISSWSKVLALTFPTECAIYDSRTAFSLNWLQFKINRQNGNKAHYLYWPTPPGTNTLLGLMNPDQILVAFYIENLSELVAYEQEHVFGNTAGARKSYLANKLRESIRIKSTRAYETYCLVLAELGKVMFPKEEHALLRTEMLLFSASTQVFPSEYFDYLRDMVRK